MHITQKAALHNTESVIDDISMQHNNIYYTEVIYQWSVHEQKSTILHCGFILTPTITLWEWVWVPVRFWKNNQKKYAVQVLGNAKKVILSLATNVQGTVCKLLLLWPSAMHLVEFLIFSDGV